MPASTRPPWEQVVRVGRAQRALIWIFLAGMLAAPISLVPFGVLARGDLAGLTYLILLVAARVAMVVGVYRVAAAFGSRVAILWAMGGLLPTVIGLVVLLLANQHATGFLKRAGLEPGVLGVKVPPDPPPGDSTDPARSSPEPPASRPARHLSPPA